MRVTLFGSRRPLDQFAGVSQRLIELGHEVHYERLWSRELRFGHHAQPSVIDDAGVLAFADLSYNAHLAPTRRARAMGIPTVLLVDGVVEHASTLANPWLGPTHLQRTPHDLVLAMGRWQGELLERLGNRVRVTGLPRLDGFQARVAEARQRVEPDQWLLVATAHTPALDDEAMQRVRTMLQEVKHAVDRRSLPTRWRLDAALTRDLGVRPDAAPLAETLAGARATLSTASTLVVESMLAGVPTAVTHPHPWPLWVPAAWTWRAHEDDGTLDRFSIRSSPSLDATLDALLDGPGLADQSRILAELHTAGAVGRVAEALRAAEHTENANPIPTMARVRVAAAPCSTLHVAVCDHEDARPATIDTALADMDAHPRAHLLCIGTSPLNFAQTNTPTLEHPRAHQIVLDPLAATHERGQAALDAALALKPERVVFGDDRALALAAQLVNRGVSCNDTRLSHRNDHAVRADERWPWGPPWPDGEQDADAWIEAELRHAGYERIAYDHPTKDCDAVLVRARTRRPHPGLVEHWRRLGLGVAASPNLYIEQGVYAARCALDELVTNGCTRIAVVHAIERSPVLAPLVRHAAPIVGWLDDTALGPTTHMGLPAHSFDAGLERLSPDGLLVLHENDLARGRAAGLPMSIIDLAQIRADELDHALGEVLHREALPGPGLNRG